MEYRLLPMTHLAGKCHAHNLNEEKELAMDMF